MNYGGIFDLESKENKLIELRQLTFAEDFWNDKDSAASTLKKISILEKGIQTWDTLNQMHGDIGVLFEFLDEGESTVEEVKKEISEFSGLIRDQELKLILGKPIWFILFPSLTLFRMLPKAMTSGEFPRVKANPNFVFAFPLGT